MPLGVRLYWRYFTLNPKWPKNTFCAKSQTKTFFIRFLNQKIIENISLTQTKTCTKDKSSEVLKEKIKIALNQIYLKNK